MSENPPSDADIPEGVVAASDPANTPPEPPTPRQEIIDRLRPYVGPGQEDAAASVVQSMMIQQSHSGPLPTAREFARYEQALPGAADRIMSLTEREQTHRHGIEDTVVREEIGIKKTGQWLAIVALVLMLSVSLTFAAMGYAKEGAALGVTIIIAVIAIFHGQKWFPKPSKEDDGER